MRWLDGITNSMDISSVAQSCPTLCVCVCVRLKVNTSNEQYFHKQHGEIRDDCFSLSSSVFIILASMNMYDFGNLKQKSV